MSLSAKYTYRKWDSKTEEYLLAVKPASEMSFNVRIHPISALNINLSYDYINREEVEGYAKMAAINDLHIGASYNVFKGASTQSAEQEVSILFRLSCRRIQFPRGPEFPVLKSAKR